MKLFRDKSTLIFDLFENSGRCLRSASSVIALSAVAALSGCGGSTDNSFEPLQAREPAPETGVFIDSPVSNLAYRTDTRQGFTNDDGEFDYILGETVIFSVAGIDLPSAEAAAIVSPQDLVGVGELEVDNLAVANIARLLQSLDTDGDPRNGIEIAAEVYNSDVKLLIDFSSQSFDADVASVAPQLISAAQAVAHLRETFGLPPVVNTIPVADAGDNESAEAFAAVGLDGSASVDADGDPLSYYWELVLAPQGGVGSFDNNFIAQPLFTVGDVDGGYVDGDYVLSLTVSDGIADSEPALVTITVFTLSADNTPPQANAGTDSRSDIALSIELDGSASFDAQGGETYAWVIISAPDASTATVTDAQSSVASFNAGSLRGVYVLRLTVSDFEVSDTDEVSVFVGPRYGVTVSSAGSIAESAPASAFNVNGLVMGSVGSGLLDAATGLMDFSITQDSTLGTFGATSGFAAGTVSASNSYDLFNLPNSTASPTACVDTLGTNVCAGFVIGSTNNANVTGSDYSGSEHAGDLFTVSTFSSNPNATTGTNIETHVTYSFTLGEELEP